MKDKFNREDLEASLKENRELLNKIIRKDNSISKLKKHKRIWVFSFWLILLACIALVFFQYRNIKTNLSNTSIVDKDSLSTYKAGYYQSLYPVAIDSVRTLADEEIIYSVQIGAFNDFYLSSENLSHLSEYNENEFNKLAIGNFTTYAEALELKKSLIQLGFKDSFLSAKSFGNSIEIREALNLSNEPRFLE